MNTQKSVYINSAQRDGGGSAESFYITDNAQRFTYPPKSVKLTAASIPHTWYNITSSNNQFNLREPPAGPFLITITPGNYSGAALATAVETALNASAGAFVYTVTYDAASLHFTVTSSGMMILDFTPSNSIATRLGFTPGSQTALSLTAVSPNLAVLYVSAEIFICSDLVGGIDNGFAKFNPNSATNDQILAVIPISGSFGDIVTFQAVSGDPFFSITQSNFGKISDSASDPPKKARFFLQFSSGFTMSLNGLDWSMTLTFDF
jgi:hypothetical protein